MGDLRSRIDAWAAKTEGDLNKGPDQLRAEQAIQLKRDYLAAETAARNAPSELKNARETYLTFIDAPGYAAKEQQLLKKDAQTIATDYRDAHKLLVDQAFKVFKMYTAVLKFSKLSMDDYVASLKRYIESARKASSSANYQSTSQRKTYYLNQEFGVVSIWDTILTLLIVSVGIVYGYHFFIAQRRFRELWLWFGLLIIFLSSYLVPIVVNFFIKIPQPVNIYSTWAKSGNSDWHG